MLSFKLSDAFVSAYADRPVPWGFSDAAGNSVGELVFLRTYSRLKEDGTKETWQDVCRRVVEGTISIQKDYAKANRLPWSDVKAQRTAEEMFERMFTFRWTPPGRGLWMMGTPLVNEHRNSAALQNCFRPDTRILTRDGIRTFAEVVGTDVEVWTEKGWTPGRVESFGQQQVQRVTFAPLGRRSNHRVTEVVTPDHRWELRGGDLTTSLQVGDVVPAAVARPDRVDEEGYRHGLIFADGSVEYVYENGDYLHSLRLCGEKAAKAGLFGRVSYPPSGGGDPVARHRSATNMKNLPASDADPAYLAGFIMGWLEFDGSGTSLATQDHAAAEWLIAHAAQAGYLVVGDNISGVTETNYGRRSAPLRRITLTETPDYWTVKAIEPLDEEEEVMCAVVPEVERFTLASGVYTSNCAFVSTSSMTKSDPAAPFAFLMEASMLGIGVGFDTDGASKGFRVYTPGADRPEIHHHFIDDTREGWVESVVMLLESYLVPGRRRVDFDYSAIRPAGAPIRTFGGTAAGPEPLRQLHEKLRGVLDRRAAAWEPVTDWDGVEVGKKEPTLTSTDILDIGNLIGVCVVSGNVRRSAELALGSIDDADFLSAKDYAAKPERADWGWMSNNSVRVNVGDDLTPVIEGIKRNGEPGIVWMDLSRDYGRLIDPPNGRDHRAMGYNPCAEQTLESFECCTLVETYLNRHASLEDYRRTLKFAYLYAKTVTLLPTHWERTNAIMQRNRRIGLSMSGIANFADLHGLSELRTWMDRGYGDVQHWDRVYSEWLCVRESIKSTTVKPSGTVSILAGESPGAHWAPGGKHFTRRIVFSKDDPAVTLFRWAGYTVEESAYTPETTVVVEFPVESLARRSEKDVTIFEKINLAATAQRHWSDNSVSVTVSFDPESEGDHIGTVLGMHEGELKTVSFLPMMKGTYAQMPYEEITAEEFDAAKLRLMKVDLGPIYAGQALDAVGEAYCTTDACEVKEVVGAR